MLAHRAGRDKAGGTSALLCVPILHDGGLVAALSLHSDLPRSWNEDEIRLAEEIAQRTWSAIKAARAQEALREGRDVIERQVRHMTRLVDDLLDVTRLATGKAPLRTERFELSTVVSHAVESVRTAIDAAGHHLALTLPAQPLALDTDPTRLSQVLANLLSNAAKYTPHGGRIALVADRDGNEVVITVADNGIGLALSRGLVVLHGGSSSWTTKSMLRSRWPRCWICAAMRPQWRMTDGALWSLPGNSSRT